MNTYKIIFTREDGTQGTDHFAAINERQARKDFGECYRHSTATIISIELASTSGSADYWAASASRGVRPAFLIY